MVVRGPAGQPFLTFEELQADRDHERRQRQQAEQRADQAEQRTARLAELSRKALQQQITPEELAELERLAAQASSPSP
jgi:hypothetical protein